MKRRHFLQHTGALAALGALATAAARANEAFPARPIRIVVPNAPGGAADITARAVGEHMGRTLGQPVVIDNKPGAGGVVAGQAVASARADGYTLLLISSGSAVSQALFKSLPYDTLKAFAPVAPLATFDLVIVAREGGEFKTLADVLAFARAHPGQLNLGTPNSAPRSTWRPSCSRAPPGSTCRWCRFAARRMSSPPSAAGRFRRGSTSSARCCRRSRPGACARWR